jgi:hypothetical protein
MIIRTKSLNEVLKFKELSTFLHFFGNSEELICYHFFVQRNLNVKCLLSLQNYLKKKKNTKSIQIEKNKVILKILIFSEDKLFEL